MFALTPVTSARGRCAWREAGLSAGRGSQRSHFRLRESALGRPGRRVSRTGGPGAGPLPRPARPPDSLGIPSGPGGAGDDGRSCQAQGQGAAKRRDTLGKRVRKTSRATWTSFTAPPKAPARHEGADPEFLAFPPGLEELESAGIAPSHERLVCHRFLRTSLPLVPRFSLRRSPRTILSVTAGRVPLRRAHDCLAPPQPERRTRGGRSACTRVSAQGRGADGNEVFRSRDHGVVRGGPFGGWSGGSQIP